MNPAYRIGSLLGAFPSSDSTVVERLGRRLSRGEPIPDTFVATSLRYRAFSPIAYTQTQGSLPQKSRFGHSTRFVNNSPHAAYGTQFDTCGIYARRHNHVR